MGGGRYSGDSLLSSLSWWPFSSPAVEPKKDPVVAPSPLPPPPKKQLEQRTHGEQAYFEQALQTLHRVVDECIVQESRVDVYVDGSLAIHRFVAPREKWTFGDVDVVVDACSTKTLSFSDRDFAVRTQAACTKLGGVSYELTRFLQTPGTDLPIRALAKCKLGSGRRAPLATIAPVVSFTHLQQPMATHLQKMAVPLAYLVPSENEKSSRLGWTLKWVAPSLPVYLLLKSRALPLDRRNHLKNPTTWAFMKKYEERGFRFEVIDSSTFA